MNDSELKLARARLMNKDINFYNAKAQELSFIKDSSKDVIFCHWALTLMDPVVPVLKTIERILKNQGVFSAIVDGDPNSATGYSDIHNIIYKFVQKKFFLRQNVNFFNFFQNFQRQNFFQNKWRGCTFCICDGRSSPYVSGNHFQTFSLWQ